MVSSGQSSGLVVRQSSGSVSDSGSSVANIDSLFYETLYRDSY